MVRPAVVRPGAHGGPHDSVRIDACIGGRSEVTTVLRGAREGFAIGYEGIGVPLLSRARNTRTV